MVNTNQQYMRLQGKDVPYEFTSIRVDQCELDPSNPRMQFLIGERGQSISEDELDQLLWRRTAVKALAASILQNGGVMDPIIVQRNGSKSKFLVRGRKLSHRRRASLLEQHRNDTRFMTAPRRSLMSN